MYEAISASTVNETVNCSTISFFSVIGLVKDALIDAIVGLSNKADAADVFLELGLGDVRHISKSGISPHYFCNCHHVQGILSKDLF